MRIGIFGTFDVENYGDLLFPMIAERELEERLGEIQLVKYSYNQKNEPTWLYDVKSLTSLNTKTKNNQDLDCILIGGGHLIRFDKTVANQYGPPIEDIPHPTGYWLAPALAGIASGLPVIWNAPSSSDQIPAWAEGLLAFVLNNSAYVSFRDRASVDAVRKAGFEGTCHIVPDTAFALPRYFSHDYLRHRVDGLLSSLGLKRRYIVIQATHRVEAVAKAVLSHPELPSDVDVLALPIGPILGDDVSDILKFLPQAKHLQEWPSPEEIAGLVACSAGVIALSLHLSITALTYDLPVLRPVEAKGGKYTPLQASKSVYFGSPTQPHDVAAFVKSIQSTLPTTCPFTKATLDQLQKHWDRIADICLQYRPAPRFSLSNAFAEANQLLLNMEKHDRKVERDRLNLRAEVGTSKVHIEELEDTLAERNTEVRELAVQLQSQEARTGELEAMLETRQAELESLNRTVAERDTQVSDLKVGIEELEGTAASREAKLGARLKEVNRRESEAKRLRQQITRLETNLSIVYASTSWRITWPMRAVSDGLRLRAVRRNARRALKLAGWLATGQFGRAANGLLPYYHRRMPLRVKARIPERLRQGVKRRLAGADVASPMHIDPSVGMAVPAADMKPPSPPRASRDGKIDYQEWIARNDTLSKDDRLLIRTHIASFSKKPKFSILMPVYNTAVEYLRQAIESVISQLYEQWELCIVDDGSSKLEIRSLIEEYARKDARIRPVFRGANGGIAACTNTALEMASGDWIVLMDHDDILSEHALYLVADALNTDADAAIIYSDSDVIDAQGHRSSPYFKPDWDYDLFLGQNLINHLGVYRTDLARQVGGFREGFEGSQDWDFALRVLEASANTKVHHIPFILYHWRQTSGSFSNTSLARAREAAQRAVNEHFQQTGQATTAVPEGHSSYLRIKRTVPVKRPLVSIIIPTRDRCDLLRTCIDGLLNRTDYEPLEIVIVDNGSSQPDALAFLADIRSREDVKVIEDPQPFNFSRLVNRGVAASSGKVCVLLNNDIDVIKADWLEEMVSHALRPEVGAVGAKLYYADDTLQHGGVILGLGGVAGHAHRRLPRNSPGYVNRLNLTHNLSCVTAACLATRREVYDQMGSFNERDLAVAFNDVDFCIRVCQAGYRIIWTPQAELYHYESLSRGYETTPEKAARFRSEVAYMRQQWGPVLDNDPFYNLNLALTSEPFSLAPVTRVRKPWREFAAGRASQHISSMNRLDTSTKASPHTPSAVFDTGEGDPRRVSAVNFVAIYGSPDSGKSSLCRKLSKVDNFLWIHSDEIFAFRIAPNLTNMRDFWSYKHRPEGQFSIGAYIDSDSFDHDLFIGYLKEELHRKSQETPATQIVLLDGYIFKHYARVFADLGLPPERTLALHASVSEGRYMVEEFNVTGHRYDEVLAYIRDSFRTKCLEATIPKSTYQSFESLGLSSTGSGKPASNTSAKYDASHLGALVLASDRFVDIGCNAGYFCFRGAEKTKGLVVGVDSSRRWLEIASHINNSIFLRNNVAFLESDAVEFLSDNPNSFEIVHCASTYHYFRDQQVEFLRAAQRALSCQGTLVLEVELADGGTGPETVMRARGVDQTPCAFPNRAMFLEQIKGLFDIKAEFESVFQSGSFYNRVYFHLRPCRTSAAADEDSHPGGGTSTNSYGEPAVQDDPVRTTVFQVGTETRARLHSDEGSGREPGMDDTATLKNTGIALLNQSDGSRDFRTVIVVGVPRSGTSMVASALRRLGIFMGENADQAVHEDVDIAHALESGDQTKLEHLISYRNQNHDIWGFKRPAAFNVINAYLHLFRNPCFIITFRDSVAIAKRNEISMYMDFAGALKEASQQQIKLTQFVSGLKYPSMLLSYEKALLDPIGFAKNLAAFCNIEADSSLLESVANTVDNGPRLYLQASRLKLKEQR